MENQLYNGSPSGDTRARHWDNRHLTMETSALMVDWDSGSSPITVDGASGYTFAGHWDSGGPTIKTNPIMVDCSGYTWAGHWDSGRTTLEISPLMQTI